MTTPRMPSNSVRNVVVVGEICVGKSSLINLVTGSNLCVTGNNMCGTTTETKAHDWNSGGRTYRLWDTPGLSADSLGKPNPKKAQDKLRTLLTDLNSKGGGAHLIVHCMSGKTGVTSGMWQAYKIVMRVRNELASDIPLAAVVTELENRSAMETWWTENLAQLSGYNMKFSYHACTTTLPDSRDLGLPGRYEFCQGLVRNLIVESIRHLDSVRNIVVVGEAGVGKSSLINLIIGSECCRTGNDTGGLTTIAQYHDWISDGQMYRIWDTPGLNEASSGKVPPKIARGVLRSLLKKLMRGRGVHLILLCMRGLPRVTKGMKQTYETVLKIRNKTASDIPLAAVITELEKLSASPDIVSSMEIWWTKHAVELSESNMKFSTHACITTLSDDEIPELPGRNTLCQNLVRNLIVSTTIGHSVCNVVVVGEIRVGKSSLINLVTGSNSCLTGNLMRGTTTEAQPYYWNSDGQTYRIWDTPGLSQDSGRNLSPEKSQGELRSLLAKLKKGGGTHLIILCMSGETDVTDDMQRVYKTIVRIRNDIASDVPLAAVITELEKRSVLSEIIPSMDKWWIENRAALSKRNMTFSCHACVTSLPDNCEPKMFGRSELCRRVVRNLIIEGTVPNLTAQSYRRT